MDGKVPQIPPGNAGVCPWDAPNEGRLHHSIRWVAALVTVGLCGLLIAHTVGVLSSTGLSNFTALYTMVVACYVFSRFVLAAIYKAPRDAGLGLTYVRNANTNLLTHMQAASYYVSFRLFKAAESVVNTR
jgi:hypothetical protein